MWLGGWIYYQPVKIGLDVPAGKLKSVSFAPFREGFSPLKERFPLPHHIEEDLELLSSKAESIRTYASLGGMEVVPDAARPRNIKVTQGAWLGWGKKDNQKEIAALIASANSHPDVVTRVIVGNEVLLRGEMDAARLVEYIRTVKGAIRQPVSYADVWSMYLKHPEIIEEVDFITIHILPYWEDEPVAIEDAPRHLENIVSKVEAEAQSLGVSKPIFIGESGWPSVGRQRGFAAPSVVNAARYTRGMIDVVTRHNLDYNIVEAFDQPWKATLEGVVGAHWGLFSKDRTPVYPLTGDVYETPHWRELFLGASLLFLAVLVFMKRAVAKGDLGQHLFIISFAMLLGLAITLLAAEAWRTSYNPLDRTKALFGVLAASALMLLLLQRVSELLAKSALDPRVTRGLRGLYLLFITFAIYRSYELSTNGRYISFPLGYHTVPLLGLIGIGFAALFEKTRLSIAEKLGFRPSRGYRLLGVAAFISAVGVIVGETWAFVIARDLRSVYPDFWDALPVALTHCLGNTQLIVWVLYLVALGLSLTRPALKSEA
jgi:exo-beta-1,3-glucanase (GH17 family)